MEGGDYGVIVNKHVRGKVTKVWSFVRKNQGRGPFSRIRLRGDIARGWVEGDWVEGA
jgi:hypothetical protein